ncbi:MAG: methyltransferase domain-containing protein, partial [Acidimicrobiales bacterium]
VLAEAFPASTVTGFDYHAASVPPPARRQRRPAWPPGSRSKWPGPRTSPAPGYDLVCFFDCLHDMGDPVGAARHVRQALADDGHVLLVEPFANDHVEDNLNPVGRAFYGFSTVICTPASLSQEVGLGLGAQAGEQRLREVFEEAGFTRFRRATETPFNLVLEARP